MLDESMKFSPVMVNAKPVPPAVAELGLSDTMFGTGLGGDEEPLPEPADPPPPHAAHNCNAMSHASMAVRLKTVSLVVSPEKPFSALYGPSLNAFTGIPAP